MVDVIWIDGEAYPVITDTNIFWVDGAPYKVQDVSAEVTRIASYRMMVGIGL